MNVETKTPWEGVENYSYDFVHPEYVPSIAKVADRYGFPVRTHTNENRPEWIEPINEGDRRVLITVGDCPRILDLTVAERTAYMYEYFLLTNYPG